MKETSLLSVKGILFRQKTPSREVLLLRNEREEWELPGGRIETGETPQECVKREIMEETGLAVTVGARVYGGVLLIEPPYVPVAKDVRIEAYGCQLAEGSKFADNIKISDEHIRGAWISLEDLSRMDDVPDVYKDAIAAWGKAQ